MRRHIVDTLLVQELQQPAGHRRVTFTQAFPTLTTQSEYQTFVRTHASPLEDANSIVRVVRL